MHLKKSLLGKKRYLSNTFLMYEIFFFLKRKYACSYLNKQVKMHEELKVKK